MTPYRDEEPRPVARTKTRWHVASGAKLLVLAAILFAAMAAPLLILGSKAAVIALVGTFLMAALADRQLGRIEVGDRRIVVRTGLLQRNVTRSISLADGGEVRVTSAAGVRERPRGRPYVSHLVEVQTPHGSWVIFESEDSKRAHAMADFARSAIPPRLRIATQDQPAAPAADIDEDSDAAVSNRTAAGR